MKKAANSFSSLQVAITFA